MSRTITTTPLYVRNKDTGELQPVAMMSGDMPEIKEELKEQKESLSALEQLMPETNPVVGKVLKVLSVNEDGTFVCEWADEKETDLTGYVKNTQYSGNPDAGVCKTQQAYGIGTNNVGFHYIVRATDDELSRRSAGYKPITATTFDYAVKCALTDGKGEAYAEAEQASARERLGIVTLTQEEYDLIDNPSDGTIYVTSNDDSASNIYIGGKRLVKEEKWELFEKVTFDGNTSTWSRIELKNLGITDVMFVVPSISVSGICAFITSYYHSAPYDNGANYNSIRTELNDDILGNLVIHQMSVRNEFVKDFKYTVRPNTEFDAYYNNPRAGYRYGYQHERVSTVFHEEKFKMPINRLFITLNSSQTFAEGCEVYVFVKRRLV